MEEKTDCLLCGEELEYLKSSEQSFCSLCGQEFAGEVRCRRGHFVCDSCHSMDGFQLIEQSCRQSDCQNPVELALELMSSPTIKMHGPEHHYLVPAVLLTAYYNYHGQSEQKGEMLEIAGQRAAKVPGGFCGFYGNCGAAVGTGLFISLITGSTPLSDTTWAQAHLMTSRSLAALAESGGPRCCKRDSFLAIIEAVDFLKENFATELPLPEEISCPYSSLNRECLGNRCRFYRL